MSGLKLVRHQAEQDANIEARVKKTGDTMTGNLTMSRSAKFVGNLQGNSDTATRLQTARNISINGVAKSFNGTGNISWTLGEIGAVEFDYNVDGGDTDGKDYPRIHVTGKEWLRTPSGGLVPYAPNKSSIGTATRQFYDIHTQHFNGKPNRGANGRYWDVGVDVGKDGVTELGRYIDFHNSKSSTSDYTFRLDNHSQNACVYHGTLSQYSDRRLKEDIKYIDDIQILSDLKIKKEEYKFKDFIKEIRFATFKYKGSKENTFGFIAQDLENFEVADYMLKDVTSNAVNDIDADENGQATYKSFDTMAYTSVVAKALQEEINHRDKQIESLEEKIKLLEKKINALVS